jgi:hypothetical protein
MLTDKFDPIADYTSGEEEKGMKWLDGKDFDTEVSGSSLPVVVEIWGNW